MIHDTHWLQQYWSAAVQPRSYARYVLLSFVLVFIICDIMAQKTTTIQGGLRRGGLTPALAPRKLVITERMYDIYVL